MDVEDLDYYPSCDSCGAEFSEQEDIDDLIFSRSTASRDLYICSMCGKDSIYISNEGKNYEK